MDEFVHVRKNANNDVEVAEMLKLSELISIYKSDDLNNYLLKYTTHNLEEPRLKLNDIQHEWKFLGNNGSNASSIGILRNGEKGLIERITNGVDAVIEKQKTIHGISHAKDSSVIIKEAFPKFYKNKKLIENGGSDQSYPFEADNQVVVAINDTGRSTKPTFDVIDKGTGIKGEEFENTILSIQHGNKIKSDKGYLIGAFGQGGSTSLPFTSATIVISKVEEKYYFTVIKAVDLEDYKNHSYVYLTIDNQIPELECDIEYSNDNYLSNFIMSESGTMIRMIEMDISSNLRNHEITKPGMLGDYINTELFNVGIPIKLIENRKNYSENAHKQNRNSFGTFSKLHTWKKYVKHDYCGTIDIEINNRAYKIDYYTILPPKEEEWGKDGEARRTFEQFNVSLDPILYTVNGQTITTEKFTKLKNAGLSFMRYRLLVVINLDVLGSEKYKFFTTDRNQIKDTDQTNGFLDKVISALANVDKLKEINSIIAEKAINNSVDNELVSEISNEVKGIYNKYLKSGLIIPGGGRGRHYNPRPEEDFLDEITNIEITTTKITFYKDQSVNIVLTTGAQKHVNADAAIYSFVDGKANYNSTPSFMNGRIQYSWDAKALGAGVHQIQFRYFKNNNNQDCIDSNIIAIEILNENSPEKKKDNQKELNLTIQIVNEQEYICDIVKNKENGSILAKLCLESDIMSEKVYGYNSSAEQIKETQAIIIKPMVLYALFLDGLYDDIDDADKKNQLIISHVRSLLASTNI